MILVVGGFGWDSMACLYYSVFSFVRPLFHLDWIGSDRCFLSFHFLFFYPFPLVLIAY